MTHKNKIVVRLLRKQHLKRLWAYTAHMFPVCKTDEQWMDYQQYVARTIASLFHIPPSVLMRGRIEEPPDE